MSQRRAKGEGGLSFDSGSGRWIGEIHLGIDPRTGRRLRRRVSSTQKPVAARRLKELRAKLEAGEDISTSPTVADLYERWLERVVRPRRAPKTVSMYEELARTQLLPEIGQRRIADLTVLDIENWLDGRGKLSKSTLTKLRSMAGQIIDLAIKYRVVSLNLARAAELPPEARPPAERRSLTHDEIRRLITAAEGHRLEAWLWLMLHTGARPGEVAALRWHDVDLEAGSVRLVATKTGGRVRTLRVHLAVVDRMVVHRKLTLEEADLAGDRWPTEHSELVFRSEAGTPIDPANSRRILRRFANTAGIDPVVPYQLRHTHASILSDQGVHAEALADRLGHRDSRTTLTYYRHPVSPIVEAGGALDLTGLDPHPNLDPQIDP